MHILKNHNNMNEEEQQPNSNQWAPDDEEAKNFVNQPGYQKGAMGMVNLIYKRKLWEVALHEKLFKGS